MNRALATAGAAIAVVLAGTSTAAANWASTGPATAHGRAVTLSAPADLAYTSKCNGQNHSLTVTWSASTAAAGYELRANATVLRTTATSITFPAPAKTVQLTVLAVNNNWRGPVSAPITACP